MPDVTALLPLPVQRLTSRLVAALPSGVVRRLAGRPVVLDGLTLHPEMALVLRLDAATAVKDWDELTPDELRESIRRQTAAGAIRLAPLAGVRSLMVQGATGPLPARLYVPRDASSPSGLLVFLHGGGHIFGDLDTHDAVCRLLAAESGARVLSVAYRLAPEHPFPAPADDATAAFRWAVAHAGELQADPARIAVGGDSAGGNLAAVVALDVRDGGDAVQPAFQLLIYPVVDMAAQTPSRALFADGFFLTARKIAWATKCHVGDPAGLSDAGRDPRASPLLADDLAGLPPAHVVTAGFDPLRDEGEAYARRLREAGVAVTTVRHDGLIHGFVNLTGLSRAAHAATVQMARALRDGLA